MPHPPSFFADLEPGEAFTIGLDRELTRVATDAKLSIAGSGSHSFSHGRFGPIRAWLGIVNEALSLVGWRLDWHAQYLRGKDRTADNALPFAPNGDHALPRHDAYTLELRAERLSSP